MEHLARDAAAVVQIRKRTLPIPGMSRDVPADNPYAQGTLSGDLRMTTLAERVDDPDVRALVREMDTVLRVAIVTAESDDAARQALERFRMLRRRANERIGKLLRSL